MNEQARAVLRAIDPFVHGLVDRLGVTEACGGLDTGHTQQVIFKALDEKNALIDRLLDDLESWRTGVIKANPNVCGGHDLNFMSGPELELEGVIADIEAGQANEACVKTLRRVQGKIERRRAALERLLKEYVAERDCLYDSVTTPDGQYDHPDSKRAVAELDAIIDEARTALGT